MQKQQRRRRRLGLVGRRPGRPGRSGSGSGRPARPGPASTSASPTRASGSGSAIRGSARFCIIVHASASTSTSASTSISASASARTGASTSAHSSGIRVRVCTSDRRKNSEANARGADNGSRVAKRGTMRMLAAVDGGGEMTVARCGGERKHTEGRVRRERVPRSEEQEGCLVSVKKQRSDRECRVEARRVKVERRVTVN